MEKDVNVENNNDDLFRIKLSSLSGALGIYKILPNCVLIQQKVNGTGYSVSGEGFRFKAPFREADALDLSIVTVDEKIDESINSPVFEEGRPTGQYQEVTVSKFSYDIQIYAPTKKNENGALLRNVSGIKKFYSERYAVSSAKKRLRQLMTRIVQRTDYHVLKTVKFSLDSIPQELSPRVAQDIKDTLLSIRNDFGLEISKVDFTDINLTENIQNAMNESRAAELENQKRINQAKANREIKQIEAEGKMYDEAVLYNIVKSMSSELGISPEQITRIIRTYYASKGNSTIIDSSGSSNELNTILALLLKSQNQNGGNLEDSDDKDLPNGKKM